MVSTVSLGSAVPTWPFRPTLLPSALPSPHLVLYQVLYQGHRQRVKSTHSVASWWSVNLLALSVPLPLPPHLQLPCPNSFCTILGNRSRASPHTLDSAAELYTQAFQRVYLLLRPFPLLGSGHHAQIRDFSRLETQGSKALAFLHLSL